MSRRTRFVTVACLFSLLSALLYYLVLYTSIARRSPTSPPKPAYRGCIVSLIRSDNLVSLNKVVNMLNSLTLYFRNIHQYPIFLFHEPTLTNETQNQIRYCASKLNIRFHEISFNVTVPSNRSGYASMCQFWSYDLWFKYRVLQSQCDYVLRFDDDSHLPAPTGYDLFEEFHRSQLDYAFRIVYTDTNGLDFIRDNLRTFLPANRTRQGCLLASCTYLNGHHGYNGLAVYNNFFLMRLNLMYEHPIIEQYLKQLVEQHAFHRYRVGDANIQTICLMLIEPPPRVSAWKFPYNHNVHGASELYSSYVYYDTVALMWHFRMQVPNVTCGKLFIAMKYTLKEKLVELQ